jgi:transglutaminase-like putative cysteine protease
MQKIGLFLSFILILLLSGCGGGLKLSPQKMLKYSGREQLPTQDEFPDHGAVVLYEETFIKLYLDSDWNVNVEETYHRAIVYFNDKAENWVTNSIKLDPDINLVNFSARTIKPNGEIIELSKKDLHPTQLKSWYVEFTDDKSVKFTFPGVEPGAILEYTYTVNKSETFFAGDFWRIQNYIPKLYSKYSVEIPAIFYRHKYNWTYMPVNIDIDRPLEQKNILTEQSDKDRSRIYYWEVIDIPALESEPNMPPYRDIGKYVSVDLKYDNWNKLTKLYWERIREQFSAYNQAEIKKLALDIIGDAEDDKTKIKRIFNYTQKNYRYLSIHIGESGYIPHFPAEIIKNKYGDCKDMAVLNVVLLRSLGIEASPALVNTKNRGQTIKELVSLDFNHMIVYVKDHSGKEYWLDATGSNCPLGEVYPSLEGVSALVIYRGGKSAFKKIPASKNKQNQLSRYLTLQINDDCSVNGHVKLKFTGNENLSIRSSLKDASKKDMQEIIERYVNANTPDLDIDSLTYDDPSQIEETFHIEFDFYRKQIGSRSGMLLIFKPGIFIIDSELDRFRDEKRKFPIQYMAPHKVKDVVEISYNSKKFEVETVGKSIREEYNIGAFSARSLHNTEGKIIFKRDFSIDKAKITPSNYQNFRNIHKAIAAANDQNIVLRRK